MDGHVRWIHTMGAGILFFLFLLLFSPKASAGKEVAPKFTALEAAQTRAVFYQLH